MLLDSLNEQQRLAASIIKGPVMVFAGAGSGKTRTLTYRIANMIENGIKPSNILAITFTNRATNEMRERLINLVGAQAMELTIKTFHSLCAGILRREIGVLGYSPQFAIIDDEDQLKIIGDIIKDNNFNKKVFTARSVRNRINSCKCLDKKMDNPTENKIWELYERYMKDANLLDFEDLLLKVREIFHQFPNILERYRNKYQHILADEFQDTDLIQYHLIKLLALKHRNIFIVGDDDQAIYSFRGANYENMVSFKEDFPEHQLVLLTQNYRSTQVILDGCNKLIKNNSDREVKELFSVIPGEPNDVVIQQCHDDNAEINYVIDNIQKAVNAGVPYKEIAILYRSSFVSRNLELALIQNDIPYRIFGGISYLKRKEIKDMIAYLRLMVFNDDIQSFKRIVNEPSRGIGQVSVDKVLDFRETNNIDLFTAISRADEYIPNRSKVLNEFKDMIEEMAAGFESKDLVKIYENLLERTKYIESLDNDEQKIEREENILEFKSILYSIENNGEVTSREDKLIAAFDEAILATDKFQDKKQSNSGVTLSTVHSSKGLEFGYVFIVAFEDGIFPNLYRAGEIVDLQEERRIAYVAATRAKNKLFLTCALRRLMYGTYRSNMQSMFLLEFIGGQIPKDVKKEEVIESINNETKDVVKEAVEYHVGDKVNHTMYGDGIIVSLNNDFGKICFTAQGMIKTFDMSHPTISKTE